LFAQRIDGQRIGGGRGGTFLQKRMQSAQQRFNLLRIEHRRRDQEGRCSGRHQRRVALKILFQRVSGERFIRSFATRFIYRRRIRSKTQFQQRLLARLLVRLGLHSHIRAPVTRLPQAVRPLFG